MPAKGRHAQYRRGAPLTPSNFSSTIIELIMQNSYQAHRPSFAFVAASWAALLAGFLAFLVGLFNA
ncbi:hypothetical protein OEZ73_26800, partial [Leclercia adecarboxylata]|nr:hypothetical protein [Leclercia adecarboxylata]